MIFGVPKFFSRVPRVHPGAVSICLSGGPVRVAPPFFITEKANYWGNLLTDKIK